MAPPNQDGLILLRCGFQEMLLSKLDSTLLPNVSIRIMLSMLEAQGFAAEDA